MLDWRELRSMWKEVAGGKRGITREAWGDATDEPLYRICKWRHIANAKAEQPEPRKICTSPADCDGAGGITCVDPKKGYEANSCAHGHCFCMVPTTTYDDGRKLQWNRWMKRR